MPSDCRWIAVIGGEIRHGCSGRPRQSMCWCGAGRSPGACRRRRYAAALRKLRDAGIRKVADEEAGAATSVAQGASQDWQITTLAPLTAYPVTSPTLPVARRSAERASRGGGAASAGRGTGRDRQRRGAPSAFSNPAQPIGSVSPTLHLDADPLRALRCERIAVAAVARATGRAHRGQSGPSRESAGGPGRCIGLVGVGADLQATAFGGGDDPAPDRGTSFRPTPLPPDGARRPRRRRPPPIAPLRSPSPGSDPLGCQ